MSKTEKMEKCLSCIGKHGNEETCFILSFSLLHTLLPESAKMPTFVNWISYFEKYDTVKIFLNLIQLKKLTNETPPYQMLGNTNDKEGRTHVLLCLGVL